MKKKAQADSGAKVVAAAGLALVAAAAGAYFVYGKDAPKRRAKVRGWALRAKGEVLEQIERLPAIDQKAYYTLVDTVSRKYAALRDVETAEVASLVRELRSHWKSISSHLAAPKKAAKKVAKKAAKKVAKKVAKKAAKKVAKRRS